MTVSRLALAAASFAFLTAAAAAEPTKYPLTLENCGETLTFQKAPASTVTVGQAATEVLYSLGLGDKVTGTSVWFNEVLPEFKEVNDKVERLADNDPSFESVVAKRPELVTAQFIWHVGPDGIVATRTQFHDVDIPTYVLPADCVAKDNTVGVDGTRSELFPPPLSIRASANWRRSSTSRARVRNSSPAWRSARMPPSNAPRRSTSRTSRRSSGSPAPRWTSTPMSRAARAHRPT